MDTGESGVGQKGKEREASVWFAGDTGYQTSDGPCPVFKGRFFSPLMNKIGVLIYDHAEIGALHGPFDLAFIPIWRGASLSFIGKLGYRVSSISLSLIISTRNK